MRVPQRLLFFVALPTYIGFVARPEMSVARLQAPLTRPTFEVASVKPSEGLGVSSFYGCTSLERSWR
jgi:hypothetical protein